MVDSIPYAELHCHSAYSFLDGVSLPQELARRAGELGHAALALTDHNSVSGSMELAQAAAEYGVRAIHGAEIDVEEDAVRTPGSGVGAEPRATRHVTLLVRDERGWSNLCRIITLAHAHTREGSARRERGEPSVDVQAVIDHAEGLICLTGCAERSVLRDGGAEQGSVELRRPYARHDRARTRALAACARRLGVRCVATGDVHADTSARAELQDAFV